MKLKVFLLVTLVVLCICSIAFAQEAPPEEEEITLTTYYPAPYGEYDKLYVDSWIRLDRTGLNTGELRFAAPDVTGTNTTLWNFHNRGPDSGAGAIPGGDGNKLYITYYDGTSWSGPHMVVAPSGNVGIGETSPGRPLEVNGVVKTQAALLDPVDPDTISNPVNGMICCDSGDNKIKQYDASIPGWNPLGAVGFGSWTDEDSANNTLVKDAVYQATSDGFISATVLSTGTEERLYGYTDSNNPPATLRIVAKTSVSGPNGYAGIIMPVRNNDYWRVTHPASVTIYWLPLGSGVCERQ